jgi:hypothetical protein
MSDRDSVEPTLAVRVLWREGGVQQHEGAVGETMKTPEEQALEGTWEGKVAILNLRGK